MTTKNATPASMKQVQFIRALAAKHGDEATTVAAGIMPSNLYALTTREASALIDVLRSMTPATPVVTVTEVAPLEPGLYRRGDDVYRVQASRETGRLYAKRLVAIGGERLLRDSGEVVHFEFVYDSGAVYRLAAADRMTLTEACEFGIRTGTCAVCSAPLKDATSVARGIGPTCRTRV